MTQTHPKEAPAIGAGVTISGQYAIIKRLGAGAVGDVFLATDLALDRYVAIKLLQPALAQRLESDARFRREARLLSRLTHPHIVTVHAFGSLAEGPSFIVMEYVEGRDLSRVLEDKGRLEPQVFCHVMRQICAAVGEAHRQGVVHRDLKPSNVLVTSLGGDPWFVKVMDFGLAKPFGELDEPEPGSDITRVGVSVGTPLYMSPEQAKGDAVDGRSDVYSLAVMASKLLTGDVPISGATMGQLLINHVTATPRLPSRLRPDLDFPRGRGIDAVLARALDKDPRQRFETSERFGEAIVRAVERWAGLDAPAQLSRGEPAPEDAGELPREATGTGRWELGTIVRDERAARLEAIRPPSDTNDTLQVSVSAPYLNRDLVVVHVALRADAPEGGAELLETLDCLAVAAQRVGQAVIERGGVLMGPIVGTGHAIVLFGLRAAEENHTERALDFALEVRGLLGALARDPTLPASFRRGLSFGLGVDAGRVVLAQLQDMPALVHGAPLADAEALATRALEAGGLVQISHAVWRRVRGLYDVGEAGPEGTRAARGKRPLARQLFAHDLHGVPIALVGRDAELAALREAYAAARQGSLRVVAISGATGIGKSRLAAELVRALQEERESLLFEVGRCTPGRQAAPYEPFVEAIRHRARVHETDAVEHATLKLEHYVRRWLAEEPTALSSEETQLIAQLRELLGVFDEGADIQTAETRSDVVGSEPRRVQLFDAVTEVYRRLATRQPVVLLIEDVQWASTPTRALIGHLSARLGDAPILVVLTERRVDGPAEVGYLRDPSALARVHLEALGPEATAELVRHALRELAEVPGWLVREITAVSSGVPLVVSEMIHDIIDAGIVRVEDGQWRVGAARSSRLSLPETVQELFLRRVDRLSPALKEALEVAAVAGRRFWPDLMWELTEGRAREEVLGQLCKRGFVVELREFPLDGEADYALAQQAVQEAVYANVHRARRARLHAEIARWLERRTPADAGYHDDLIAHHYERAGEGEAALRYRKRAAARAKRLHAFEEAAGHLESCRALLQEQGAEPAELAVVTADLVEALVLSGQLKRAVELSEDRTADEAGIRTAISRGRALEFLGRYGEARDAFREARERVAQGGDALLLLMAITGEAGAETHLGVGEGDDALSVLAGLLDDYDAQPGIGGELLLQLSVGHRVRANAELRQGRYDGAEEHYQRAYDLALSGNAPVAVVDALNGLAALHYYRGDHAEAERTWRLALHTADKWELVRHQATILNNVGELEWTRGAPESALETLSRAEALHAWLGTDEIADTYRLLAECELALGDRLAAAERHAGQAVEAAERLSAPYYAGLSHRTMAKVLAAKGDPDPGELARHLDASVAAFERGGMDREAEATRALREEIAPA